MKANHLPPNTRVWIYQSDRNLTPDEINDIQLSANQFIKNWAAHGEKLEADIEVRHNRFIVIFANQESVKASGCSIDSSVKWLKEIELKYNISLLNNKMQVAYKSNGEIMDCQLENLQNVATPQTLVFNNLITTKGELETNWLIPIKESWHNQFLLSSTTII